MGHDPAHVEETRAWLTKTASDLRGAEVDLAADPPLLEDLLFHCQQAAEKAFKAYLVWHNRPFRRTHDLREVGNQCVEIDPTLAPLVARAEPLSDYAWQFRYPGGDPPPSPEEAVEALALAREVVEAILTRLPPETHP